MGQVVVVGLDIAKSVFQVHGVDHDGAVVVRRGWRRSRVLPFFATVEPCRIGIEVVEQRRDSTNSGVTRPALRRGRSATRRSPAERSPPLPRLAVHTP
jgi:hypothetical protein